MVTVPTTFAPQVDYNPGGMVPMQAPEVQPMENKAPAQQMDMGQKISTAANAVLKIGQRIQDEIDESEAKAADVASLREAQELLRGENGYLHTAGKDAEARYAETQQKLGEIFARNSERLSNDVQRRMFEQVGTRNMMTLEGQMADHKFTQVRTYSVNETTGRMNEYTAIAARSYTDRNQRDADGTPIGPFHTALNTALAEADNLSRLNGWDLNGSQAKAQRNAVYTTVTTSVVSSLLDEDNVAAARSYFNEQLEAGNLDTAAATRLANVIDGVEDRVEVISAVDRYTSGDIGTTEEGRTTANLLMPVDTQFQVVEGGQFGASRDSGARSHNGMDLAVPVGTKVRVPYDGEIIRVWNDTDAQGGEGGLSMQIRLDNGDVVGFAHLSAYDVKEGRVTRGQVVARSGDTGAGGPHLHYTLRRNGQPIDPRTANDNSASSPLTDTQESLDAALAAVRRDYADKPLLREQIEAGVRQNWGQLRQAEEIRQRDLLQQAEDAWYKAGGDWRSIPSSIWGQLKPGDQRRFREGIPRKSDEDTILYLLSHPEDVVPGKIEQYRGKLSEGDYRSFFAKAHSSTETTVRAVSLDNDQLNAVLNANELGYLVAPKANTPEAAQSISLQTRIRDIIDTEQSTTGKELTRDRKRQIMEQVIMDQAFVSEWGRDSRLPVSMMTPDQLENAYVKVGREEIPLSAIPSGFRQAAINALTAAGRPVSEQEIANRWIRAGRPR